MYNKIVESISLIPAIVSFAILLAIFILNLIVGMYYSFGSRHYWFPQTLHFLGGFFAAMFFASFLQSAVSVLAGLGIVTVLWEFIEFLIAKIPVMTRYVKKWFRLKKVGLGWKDTIFDIILNFSGAILFIYLFK